MRHIFLYFVLIYVAMAAETKLPSLPKQETYMDKSGWVYVFVRDLSTIVVDSDGNWNCDAKLERITQEDYLRRICEKADVKDKLRLVAHLSKYWVGPDEPWKALNLTKEQYDDWLETGVLKTQAELDALKQAKADAQQQQVAAAMAEISAIKYYLNVGTGVWHVDAACPDNTGTIEINPLDILSVTNRKACDKCVK